MKQTTEEKMLKTLRGLDVTLTKGLLNRDTYVGTDTPTLAEIRDSLEGIRASLDFLSEVIEKGFMYLVDHLPSGR